MEASHRLWNFHKRKIRSTCTCKGTMFENYSKCRIWIFEFWHFQPIFVLLKLTCLVTLFDRKLQGFKNSPKWTIFGVFNSLLSTQNVNVARFARNVEWDFFCDFQTPWIWLIIYNVSQNWRKIFFSKNKMALLALLSSVYAQNNTSFVFLFLV